MSYTNLMAIICPTVLAREPHEYREQMERIGSFAQRIQIDIADGEFAPVTTVGPSQLWWPRNVGVDIHVMYQKPADHIAALIKSNPSMVILHAEAEGNFIELATALHDAHIKVGIALLPNTPPEMIAPSIGVIDHVLLFSGDLGNFGGRANLALLEKIPHLKKMKPSLEIGWDGGVNKDNASELASGGVDVLNVGGFIQRADDPAAAFGLLLSEVQT